MAMMFINTCTVLYRSVYITYLIQFSIGASNTLTRDRNCVSMSVIGGSSNVGGVTPTPVAGATACLSNSLIKSLIEAVKPSNG